MANFLHVLRFTDEFGHPQAGYFFFDDVLTLTEAVGLCAMNAYDEEQLGERRLQEALAEDIVEFMQDRDPTMEIYDVEEMQEYKADTLPTGGFPEAIFQADIMLDEIAEKQGVSYGLTNFVRCVNIDD